MASICRGLNELTHYGQRPRSSLSMACCLFGAKTTPEPIHQLDPTGYVAVKSYSKFKHIIKENSFQIVICGMLAIFSAPSCYFIIEHGFSDPVHEKKKSFENSLCCNYDSNDQIRSQSCPCHNSWAVVTCAKFWPDLLIVFHAQATHILMRFGT